MTSFHCQIVQKKRSAKRFLLQSSTVGYAMVLKYECKLKFIVKPLGQLALRCIALPFSLIAFGPSSLKLNLI